MVKLTLICLVQVYHVVTDESLPDLNVLQHVHGLSRHTDIMYYNAGVVASAAVHHSLGKAQHQLSVFPRLATN